MKKKLLLLLIIYSPASFIFAQWQPDVQLTNDPARSTTSGNNAVCITAWSEIVHAVWFDKRDGNWEIYYKRSTDAGMSWGIDMRLTNDSAESAWPSVAVWSSNVFVVWQDKRDGNEEIYFKRSTSAGASWGTDFRLTNDISYSEWPSLAVNTAGLYAVWDDDRNGNNEIYFKRSVDGGLSWGADTRLTNYSSSSERPSISVTGSMIHIVWQDRRNDNDWEIYYKYSTNGGVSWGVDRRLTNFLSFSGYACVTVSDHHVHVSWTDWRDGNDELYYKRSTNDGIDWGPDKRLTNSTYEQSLPSITSFGKIVHLAWRDDRAGNTEVYYNNSTDYGESWGVDTRLTSNAAHSYNPFIAVSGPVVHVLWKDDRTSNDEIFYKRNPTGSPFGINKISSEIPEKFSLYQNYPNPFNPATKIRFALPFASLVNLTVYDLLGHEIEKLVNEHLSAGKYEAEWNATDFPSGVYFYKMTTGDFADVKKMVLVK